MDLIKRAVLILAAGSVMLSCADSDTEPYDIKEIRSFERWMELNINTDPANPVAEKLDNGMYIQWLQSDPAETERPQAGRYLELDYRGMLLSDWNADLERGSIFMTRYEGDARRLGTFTEYTHYVPQLINYSRNNNLMEGMLSALEYMKKGDEVRLFLPSELAYTTYRLTASYGYGGNTTQPSGQPVIFEFALRDIIKDPMLIEQQMVADSAEKWGIASSDAVVRKHVYLNVIDTPNQDDTVRVDSSITLRYYAKLMSDGFLLNTNIEEVAKDFKRDASTITAYKASSPPSSPNELTIDALVKVIETERLSYGATFEFVTTSDYAFGESGISPASGVTEVLPFQAVYYRCEIAPRDEDDDDE